MIVEKIALKIGDVIVDVSRWECRQAIAGATGRGNWTVMLPRVSLYGMRREDADRLCGELRRFGTSRERVA